MRKSVTVRIRKKGKVLISDPIPLTVAPKESLEISIRRSSITVKLIKK